MTKIIETHIQYDNENNIRDHQTRVLEINETWDDYCQAFNNYNGEAIRFKGSRSNMFGDIVPHTKELHRKYVDDRHMCYTITNRAMNGYVIHLAQLVDEWL